MKKVLVLGATGLIGHQVYYHLQETGNYQVVAMANTRKLDEKTIQVDARNEHAFIKELNNISPDIIINCMGVLISEANRNPEHTIFLNAYMPHRLKRFANEVGAKLIHISTDCVFSGKKGAYTEADIKDADDIYGRAKALGEIIDDKHLTLRTSVVGPELKDGEELFHWFMFQQGKIQGYTKSIWSGVTTLELAKVVEWSIKYHITGLYHVTNGQPINKYNLLMLFKKYTGKRIDIQAVDGRVTDKSFLDTRKEYQAKLPSYDEMIDEMIGYMKSHSELYSQYSL